LYTVNKYCRDFFNQTQLIDHLKENSKGWFWYGCTELTCVCYYLSCGQDIHVLGRAHELLSLDTMASNTT